MKSLSRRFALLVSLALILALSPTCLAALPDVADKSLDELMEQFRADNGLTAENFSLCYYDTASGEEYRFNDTKFMVAASTYKLPLNLYYYELEQSGELSPDTVVGGMRLADAHCQSLVWSNNDVSVAMLYRLGNFRTYKDRMRKYFTMDESKITSDYYADNNYCTSMMLDTLKYLYAHREQFGEMIGYLKQAQPGQYFDRYVEDYEVAHKYGFYIDDDKGVTAVNDTGIIFTPQPFLLAVYTANAPGGEEVVSRACELLTAYNLAQHPQEDAQQALEPSPEEVPPQTPAAEPEEPSAGTVAPAQDGAQDNPPAVVTDTPEETVSRNLWWMILIAASIFLAADLVVILALRRGWPARGFSRREKREQNADESSKNESSAAESPK